MSGPRRPWWTVLVLVIGGTAACAREEMPPGHGPDFEPPAVVEMFPVYGSAVPDLDEDAFIRFDEPLGDPRSVQSMLFTSPAWTYEVRTGRSNARIRPSDGWRPDVVYHFKIRPGLRDLIRNETRTPIEFLFTTGSELTATQTVGRILDRESVRLIRGAQVLVLGADSVPYVAETDTAGMFTIVSLPTGAYWAFGFEDQNSNRLLDRDFESHDSSRVDLPDATARADLELWLVPPDTTPPMLVEARALDGLQVRLDFDDLLEPDHPLATASVRISVADTGEEWPIEDFLIGAPEVAEDSAAAVSDSAAAGSPDSATVVPQDTAGARPDVEVGEVSGGNERAGGRRARAPPEPDSDRARPQQYVTVRLARALEAGTYVAGASGFANLRLLTGGGDTTFVFEPPPPEAAEPVDPEEAQVEPAVGPESDGEIPPGATDSVPAVARDSATSLEEAQEDER